MHDKRSRGFSLIEMLVVVTVILIVAAIALPKLLTVKQQATSTGAVSNLRTLNDALNAYADEYPTIGYPTSITVLGPPASGGTPSSTLADLIDDSLAAAGTVPKGGYLYTYTPGTDSPASTFTITAAPQGSSATRYYYMDQDGVIRYNDGSAATATSQIIG